MNKIMMTVLLVTTLFVSACGSDSDGTTPAAPEGKTTELEGIWVGVCQQTGSDTSDNNTLTFSGNKFTRTFTSYSDATCTVADLSHPSFSQSGIFVIGGSVTSSSGMAAKEIDVTIQQPINSQLYDIFTINNGRLYMGLATMEKDYSSPENRPVTLDLVEYLVNITTPVATTSELEGVWVSLCELLIGRKSQNVTLTITGSTFNLDAKQYSDSACTGAGSIFHTRSGTMVIGDSLITSSGWDAKQFDMTFLKENGADVNVKQYNIYSIDNMRLYVGNNIDGKDGTTATNRPIDLDFEWYFNKQ